MLLAPSLPITKAAIVHVCELGCSAGRRASSPDVLAAAAGN